MLIPQFWAESRKQGRIKGRSVTVKRFGWSNSSQLDAERHAQVRAEEAFARIESGETLLRREPKRAYNGAEGVPIREEILATHGSAVLTRNGYGATCLNTLDVFFADIDFDAPSGSWWWIAVLEAVGASGAGALAHFWLQVGGKAFWVYVVIGAILSYPIFWVMKSLLVFLLGGKERLALWKVRRFLRAKPDWNTRIYRTPAGLRLLAMHRTFDPNERASQEAFLSLGTDPVYVRMCQNQHCFRARLSPKPWRLSPRLGPIPPRRGVWPVSEDYLPLRKDWVREYEAQSLGYASCRFLEEVGSGVIDPAVRPLLRLHDDLCRAESDLPLA